MGKCLQSANQNCNDKCNSRTSGLGIRNVLLARSRKQTIVHKLSRDSWRRDPEICKARIDSSKSDDLSQPSDKDVDRDTDKYISARKNSDADSSDDDDDLPRKLHYLRKVKIRESRARIS